MRRANNFFLLSFSRGLAKLHKFYDLILILRGFFLLGRIKKLLWSYEDVILNIKDKQTKIKHRKIVSSSFLFSP